jgi:predicted transcriptional regulator
LLSEELTITGNEALNIIQGLSSITNFKILQLLSKGDLDISTIARRMNLSEAHISGEISRLADLHLVKVTYAPGKRGIRKICKLAVRQISITLTN